MADWVCPRCTVCNAFLSKRCHTCDYSLLNAASNEQRTRSHLSNMRLTPSSSSSSSATAAATSSRRDPSSSRNNKEVTPTPTASAQPEPSSSSAKTPQSFIKVTMNSIGSDLKNFISGHLSGIGPPKQPAGSTKRDLPDVIEISPPTSSAARGSSSSSTWTCPMCTFAANPMWSDNCEICNGKKPAAAAAAPSSSGGTNNSSETPAAAVVPKPNTNTNTKSNDTTDASRLTTTIYDTSLSQDIYDYARIWSCAQCTYINFEQDESCELCLTPRSATQNNSQKQPQQQQQQQQQPVVAPGVKAPLVKSNSNWVCQRCTYFNAAKTDTCLACNWSPRHQEHLVRDKATSATSASASTSTLTCRLCSYKNAANATRCAMCSHRTNSDNVNGSEEEEDDDDDDDDDDVQYQHLSSQHRAANNTSSSSSLLNTTSTSRALKAKSSIKAFANATTQAERTWNLIVNYCKQNRHKFVDDSFPPCDKSLFVDVTKKPVDNHQLRNIIWLSPESIRTHHTEAALKWTVYNQPKFNDIKQGLLGNCWYGQHKTTTNKRPHFRFCVENV